MFEVKIVFEVPVESIAVTLADVQTIIENQIEDMVAQFDERLDKQIFGDTRFKVSFDVADDANQKELDLED